MYHPRSENTKWDSTEWDDIHRKLGNLPPCAEDLRTVMELERAELEHQMAEDKQAADEEKLAKAAANELDFEDFEDEDEERFMEEYRRKRMMEMQKAAVCAVGGDLRYIDATEWKEQVTNAAGFVVVLLFKEGIEESNMLEQILVQLAKKHSATKFVKIVSTNAIRNYPDCNVPTLLVYHDTDIVQQIIGLREFGGTKATLDDVEWVLAQTGALQTSLDEDPRQRFFDE